MSFNRTDFGRVAQYRFYSEPLVWVEGDTDIPFYEQALKNDEGHRVKSAGGKDACLKLVDSLVREGLPYVVILDGDYEILSRRRSSHRYVVLLHRHSMENYLFEKKAIESVCCSYACVDQKENLLKDSFDMLMETLKTELTDLVLLDIAHHLANTGNKVLPDNVASLIKSKKEFDFNRSCIEESCAECRKTIDGDTLDRAKVLLEDFLGKRRFVDILQGHFVLSILRHLVQNTVKRMGHKPNIDNRGLVVVLSLEVWSRTLSSDHKSLRKRLLKAVAEVREKIQSNT